MPINNNPKRMIANPWLLPTSSNTIQDATFSLARGQVLLVKCDNGFDYIPCFPKPGASKMITRVPNGTWVLFLGIAEFNGEQCLEFMNQDEQGNNKEDELFYLGYGALPFLLNIPKRRVRPGNPFRKNSGSKTQTSRKRKAVSRRKKNKTRPGTGLKNFAVYQAQQDRKKDKE